MQQHTKTCNCGSGLLRHELKDARGIFCAFVCDECEPRKRKEFRDDIFTDADYWHDEPVDGD